MEKPDSLDACLHTAWHLLNRGAAQKRDPLHTFTLGTAAPDGPRLRTVVLRKTFRERRGLHFYTDFRSHKVTEIEQQAAVSALFWHPKKNVQLRLRGHGSFENQTDRCRAIWDNLPVHGRKTYGTVQAPGQILDDADDDLPAFWQQSDVEKERTDYAFAHFAVGTLLVQEIEWLLLDRQGHQRAAFNWVEDGWRGNWLVP